MAIHQHGARAVHGLYGKVLLVNLGEIHVLAVVGPVTRAFPQDTVQDNRRANLLVTRLAVLFAPEVLKFVADNHALRVIEREPRAFFLDAKQIQLFA
ncbi:MAG: hypothetical protein DDT39_01552 [Firmicutes bacterium]|nr:hypothetical protein [candidate division NPL-UPA2 bacterium]